ncbi:MAG: glycosyltransferase [Candidatus Omnitrophota bacterium]|jgi:GT2 family glycosyltransferase
MMNNPLATIIVVTRNRLEILEKMLKETRRQEDYAGLEIIVANDAGEIDIKDRLKSSFPEINFINFPRRLGLVESRNRLFKEAKGDFVFFLDDDSWFEQESAVLGAIEVFRQYPRAAILSFALKLAGRESPYEVGSFTGCAHALRRSFFRGSDIYDGDYFRQGEERDLAIAALEKGYTILQVDGIRVYHEASALERDHQLIHSYAFSNEMFFYLKYFPGIFSLLFMVKCLIAHAIFCLKKGWFKAYFWGWRRFLNNFAKFKKKRRAVKIKTLKKYLYLTLKTGGRAR